MTSTQTLIGIIGRKGSGKDTASTPLFDKGYENVKFAGGLKAMIRALLAYQKVDAETIDRMIEGDLKTVETRYLGGRTPRYAMETLGTEWGRKLMADDLWVNMTMDIAMLGPSIITDVRFPNEFEALERVGAILFGIVADWIKPTPGEHESETSIDNLISRLPDDRVVRNRRAADGAEDAAIRSLQENFASALSAAL